MPVKKKYPVKVHHTRGRKKEKPYKTKDWNNIDTAWDQKLLTLLWCWAVILDLDASKCLNIKEASVYSSTRSQSSLLFT